MMRDELPNAIGKALIAKYDRYDGEADVIMPLIDQYVAAERERIAQAIEAEAAKREHEIADIARVAEVRTTGTTGGMREAARIVRAEA